MPALSSSALAQQVRSAHADAWAALGRLFVQQGGAAERLPGVRLMASGLPHAKWNGGDVTEPELVDVAAVRAWFAERGPRAGGVPWRLRLPAGAPWPHGRPLVGKRCAVLLRGWLDPAPVPDGVRLREAGPGDAEAVARVDAAAFERPVADSRARLTPKLGVPGVLVVLAEQDGEPVGTVTALLTDEDAGPAVALFGVGVVPGARGRGLGAAITAAATLRGLLAGAAFAHVNPDTEQAARMYARLGFVETDGLDVYLPA